MQLKHDPFSRHKGPAFFTAQPYVTKFISIYLHCPSIPFVILKPEGKKKKTHNKTSLPEISAWEENEQVPCRGGVATPSAVIP